MGSEKRRRQFRGDVGKLRDRAEVCKIKLSPVAATPAPKPVPPPAPVLPDWDPLAEVREFEAKVVFCKVGQFALLKAKTSSSKLYLASSLLKSASSAGYLPTGTNMRCKATLHAKGWKITEVISVTPPA